MQRETAGGRGGGDAGNGVDALGAIVDHLGDSAGFLKAVATDRHGHGEDVVGVESGIDGLQLHERANQQRGPDDQHKRKSHLADDENGTHLAAAETYSGAVAALIQNCCEVLAGGGDRGHQAEENSGQHGNCQSEEKHVRVDGDRRAIFADARDASGIDGEKEANAGESENESEDSAGEGYHQAFCEQLTDDVPASGAEGRAGSEFALACGGANQQEIRNVGTGNQEH